MNELYRRNIESYFSDKADEYFEKLKEDPRQSFFINTRKASKDEILQLLDFEYEQSPLNEYSFIHHEESIGKTKAYELGLIYPQDTASSLTTKYIDRKNIKTIVDLCAAPGGKTINVLNYLDEDVLCISNDTNHQRCQILSSNIERLGLDSVIVTNKPIHKLSGILEGFADLVILDAPCSGEGIVRKYPEIMDDYSQERIDELADLQKHLLEEAYLILKKGGQLVYSTCTYSFAEDEDQILSFLERHPDMELMPLPELGNSTLKGTVKLSPLDDTEGQFIALMRKEGVQEAQRIKTLKPSKSSAVEEFIRKELDIPEHYLYENNGRFSLSFTELPDMEGNVLRSGIYLGEMKDRRFEPAHSLYRANSLKGCFKNVIDLDDHEYEIYISGGEVKREAEKGYCLITYKGHSLGFGKSVNGVIKNKYPKGLRRML